MAHEKIYDQVNSVKDMLEVEYDIENKPINGFPQLLVNHIVEKYKLKGKVLDVMCGRGEHAQALQNAGLETWCVDMSENAAEIFENRGERLRNADMNLDKIPYDDESFDVVWCKSAIEHVNADHLLGEFRRILKPGGKVVILTTDWYYMFRIHYIDHTHGYGTPWMRQSLKSILTAYGFDVQHVDNFLYLPLTWKNGLIGKLARFFCWFIRLLPYPYNDNFTNPVWKLVRWSNEVQLIGVGIKK